MNTNNNNALGANAAEQNQEDITALIPAHAMAAWEQLQRECAERAEARSRTIAAAKARGIDTRNLCC
jgi:hypothetical protein